MTEANTHTRWFEDHADHYEELATYAADFGQQLIDFADPAPATRLLDVGAGRGAATRAAVARGCAVIAIDVTPAMVRRLAADLPEITVRQMDVARLDFPPGSFDTVVAADVVEILEDPAAAVAQMRRVLAPGGTIALSVHGVRGGWEWLARLAQEFWPAPEPAADAAPLVDPAALLAEAGFTEMTQRPVAAPVVVPSPSALWKLLESQMSLAAVTSLPAGRAAEFRRRFWAGAEHMHAHGGIVLDHNVILHRAVTPA